MRKTFPFFRFVMKNESEKGHVKSMQMITRDVVTTPFVLHLEDDWFFYNRICISDMIEILMDRPDEVKQVCINKNYDNNSEKRCKGGIEFYTAGNLRYFIHEYCTTDEEKRAFAIKYGDCLTCNYWPYYSLQPSLVSSDIFRELSFEEEPHFELAFAKRYAERGWKTAFLQESNTRHIGKNIWDVEGQNAYELNNVKQF